MASPLVCDRWRHAAAADGVSGSSNKRRRRCFSSVPLQPAVEPPSPFSSAPSTGRRFGGAASSASPPHARSSLPSRCAMRAAGARSSASSPAAGMPAACAARGTVASPVQHDDEEEEEEWVQPSSTRLRRHHPYRRAATGAGSSRATRGLLSRATTVAVTVAAVVVSAYAPVGVSAVMSKEQCKDATFRGTVDDLMESPRADTATEAAAAGIDRTIVASQETYERMVADQASITLEEGLDVPFRNLWSDHVWLQTARVTFPDVATMGLFTEGSPPEFNCMNEYYGMAFEWGEAVATPVYGTLNTTGKVLNWDVLGEDYLALDGLESFVPTDEQTVTSTTSLVAAREESIAEDFGSEFSVESSPHFHYFLSVPAEDVDPSACPEPCTGEVVAYYWSQAKGAVYLLDRVSAVAETQPCWLELFQTVADGAPVGGVDNELWEASGACTAGLLQGVEDAIKSGEASSAASAADTGAVGGEDGGGDGTAAVAAAVVIPALLVSFAVAAFALLRHQKGQRLKKMKTTDEAWGEGLDGSGGGVMKPRPPTGRFKLGVAVSAAVAAAGEGGGVAAGIARLKSFPPPERVFTDVSIDDQDCGVGVVSSPERRDEEEGRLPEDEGGDEDGEDMIYPM